MAEPRASAQIKAITTSSDPIEAETPEVVGNWCWDELWCRRTKMHGDAANKRLKMGGDVDVDMNLAEAGVSQGTEPVIHAE